jgi:hypothetical protein
MNNNLYQINKIPAGSFNSAGICFSSTLNNYVSVIARRLSTGKAAIAANSLANAARKTFDTLLL